MQMRSGSARRTAASRRRLPPAEHAAVQVSQLHDAKPVERGRQGRETSAVSVVCRLQFPQQESGGKQGRQHEQDGGFPAAHGGFLPFKSFFA